MPYNHVHACIGSLKAEMARMDIEDEKDEKKFRRRKKKLKQRVREQNLSPVLEPPIDLSTEKELGIWMDFYFYGLDRSGEDYIGIWWGNQAVLLYREKQKT